MRLIQPHEEWVACARSVGNRSAMIAMNCNQLHTHIIYYTIMSAIKFYSNDSFGIVMWDHMPGGALPHMANFATF